MKKYSIYKNNPNDMYFIIKALKDIYDISGNKIVSEGESGGCVKSEKNLSQEGSCWIFNNCIVVGDAFVSENAILKDGVVACQNAQIKGNANVSGCINITGEVIIKDNACISGVMLYNGSKALISGKSVVFGNAMLSGCFQIYDNVRISQNAKINGNITLRHNVKIFGNATICDNAKITGSAKIYDNALIKGNATVFGFAKIYGDAIIQDSAVVCGTVYQNAVISEKVHVSYGTKVFGNSIIKGETVLTECIASFDGCLGENLFNRKKLRTLIENTHIDDKNLHSFLAVPFTKQMNISFLNNKIYVNWSEKLIKSHSFTCNYLYEEISLLWDDISKKASSPKYCETAKQICSFLREIPYINLKEKIEALSKKIFDIIYDTSGYRSFQDKLLTKKDILLDYCSKYLLVYFIQLLLLFISNDELNSKQKKLCNNLFDFFKVDIANKTIIDFSDEAWINAELLRMFSKICDFDSMWGTNILTIIKKTKNPFYIKRII